MSNYETISVSDNPNEGTKEGTIEGRKEESEIDRLRFPQTIRVGGAAPRVIEQRLETDIKL